MMSRDDMRQWMDRLLELGRAVQGRVVEARAGDEDLARPVAQQGGDTIFAVDRHVEPVIEDLVDQWTRTGPGLRLVMEGLGESGQCDFGRGEPRLRLLIDPIDGTRNLMYDKRSAWFLAALAPEVGDATHLRQALVSVIVELPTSRQTWAGEFAAVAGQACEAWLRDLSGEARRPLTPAPSRAPSLRQGFAQVSNFFPGTKILAASLMERIVLDTLGDVEPGSAAVFDDQYITTGGQFIELMLGRDRFCCDLRPLFYDIVSQRQGRPIRGLECHPYDCAGLLAAQQAGVIITDGFGRPLDPPMNVHHGVHWCGYANAALRDQIQPVIQQWLAEQGLQPESSS